VGEFPNSKFSLRFENVCSFARLSVTEVVWGTGSTYPRIISLRAPHGVGNFTIRVLYPQGKSPVHRMRLSVGKPRRRCVPDVGRGKSMPLPGIESCYLTHSQSLCVKAPILTFFVIPAYCHDCRLATRWTTNRHHERCPTKWIGRLCVPVRTSADLSVILTQFVLNSFSSFDYF
jgi:hypothetical protein